MYVSPQVIIWEQDTGVLALCFPTGEMPVEQVAQKDCPSEAIIKNRDELPFADYDFHEAWVLNGDRSVSVDLDRAKGVTKNRLRFEREALFASLDADFMKALERGEDTSAIVAEKQRLRDITKLPDVCTTLDELRSIKVTQ